MDMLQYEQYSSVIKSGNLSLDGLKRIIKHDAVSNWSNTSGGQARIKVLHDCQNGIIKPFKLFDELGDYLYGNSWPLPLSFKKKK